MTGSEVVRLFAQRGEQTRLSKIAHTSSRRTQKQILCAQAYKLQLRAYVTARRNRNSKMTPSAIFSFLWDISALTLPNLCPLIVTGKCTWSSGDDTKPQNYFTSSCSYHAQRNKHSIRRLKIVPEQFKTVTK